ncbi:hypothetical protein ACFL4G_05185 [Thermodesulfobacteriota bacterium]
MIEGILISVVGAACYTFIKEGLHDLFGDKSRDRIDRILEAFDYATQLFFNRFGEEFGKPSESFLARQENWEAVLASLKYTSPPLSANDLNPAGYQGVQSATCEAVDFFLETLENSMANDSVLDDFLAHRKSFMKIDTLVESLESGKHSSRIDSVMKFIRFVDREAMQDSDSRHALQRALACEKIEPTEAIYLPQLEEVIPFYKELKDRRRLGIRGNFGEGKSTLAAHIAYQFLCELEEEKAIVAYLTRQYDVSDMPPKDRRTFIDDLMSLIDQYTSSKPFLLVIDDAHVISRLQGLLDSLVQLNNQNFYLLWILSVDPSQTVESEITVFPWACKTINQSDALPKVHRYLSSHLSEIKEVLQSSGVSITERQIRRILKEALNKASDVWHYCFLVRGGEQELERVLRDVQLAGHADVWLAVAATYSVSRERPCTVNVCDQFVSRLNSKIVEATLLNDSLSYLAKQRLVRRNDTGTYLMRHAVEARKVVSYYLSHKNADELVNALRAIVALSDGDSFVGLAILILSLKRLSRKYPLTTLDPDRSQLVVSEIYQSLSRFGCTANIQGIAGVLHATKRLLGHAAVREMTSLLIMDDLKDVVTDAFGIVSEESRKGLKGLFSKRLLSKQSPVYEDFGHHIAKVYVADAASRAEEEIQEAWYSLCECPLPLVSSVSKAIARIFIQESDTDRSFWSLKKFLEELGSSHPRLLPEAVINIGDSACQVYWQKAPDKRILAVHCLGLIARTAKNSPIRIKIPIEKADSLLPNPIDEALINNTESLIRELEILTCFPRLRRALGKVISPDDAAQLWEQHLWINRITSQTLNLLLAKSGAAWIDGLFRADGRILYEHFKECSEWRWVELAKLVHFINRNVGRTRVAAFLRDSNLTEIALQTLFLPENSVEWGGRHAMVRHLRKYNEPALKLAIRRIEPEGLAHLLQQAKPNPKEGLAFASFLEELSRVDSSFARAALFLIWPRVSRLILQDVGLRQFRASRKLLDMIKNESRDYLGELLDEINVSQLSQLIVSLAVRGPEDQTFEIPEKEIVDMVSFCVRRSKRFKHRLCDSVFGNISIPNSPEICLRLAQNLDGILPGLADYTLRSRANEIAKVLLRGKEPRWLNTGKGAGYRAALACYAPNTTKRVMEHVNRMEAGWFLGVDTTLIPELVDSVRDLISSHDSD